MKPIDMEQGTAPSRRASTLSLAGVEALSAGRAGALMSGASTGVATERVVTRPRAAAAGDAWKAPLRLSAMTGGRWSRDIALAVGDIASCRFPRQMHQVGDRPRARPCLVLGVWREEDGTLCAKVACSTEAMPETPFGPVLAIEKPADLKVAGIERARHFFLGTPKIVLVNPYVFDPNRAGKVVFGRLSKRLWREFASLATEVGEAAREEQADCPVDDVAALRAAA